MKDLGKLFVYLLATVLVGSLLAPWLFWGAHEVAAHHSNSVDFTNFIEKTDFQRFFNRSILIAAILLLFPLIRTIRIPDRAGLGLQKNPTRWKHFGAGFSIAFLSVVVMAGFALWVGPYKLRGAIHWEKMLWLPFSAVAVSFVEEYLFRGVIQGIAQRILTHWMAVGSVSALFAIIHFLKPPLAGIAAADVRWYSGLDLLTGTFWQFGEPQLLLWGVSTLFLVAVVLGYARVRTRALSMSIGLHSGWVLSKMSFSIMTRRNGETWPWFGSDILEGMVPLLIVGATGLVVWWWLNHADKKRDHGW